MLFAFTHCQEKALESTGSCRVVNTHALSSCHLQTLRQTIRMKRGFAVAVVCIDDDGQIGVTSQRFGSLDEIICRDQTDVRQTANVDRQRRSG